MMGQPELTKSDFTARTEPFRLFGEWLEDATKSEVNDPNGVALASIGVTYLNRRRAAIRPEEVVERLRETCRTISAEIADLPGGPA